MNKNLQIQLPIIKISYHHRWTCKIRDCRRITWPLWNELIVKSFALSCTSTGTIEYVYTKKKSLLVNAALPLLGKLVGHFSVPTPTTIMVCDVVLALLNHQIKRGTLPLTRNAPFFYPADSRLHSKAWWNAPEFQHYTLYTRAWND